MPIGGGSGEGGLAQRGYNGPAQPGGNVGSGIGSSGNNGSGNQGILSRGNPGTGLGVSGVGRGVSASGQNFRSAYGASSPNTIGPPRTVPFGWQPYNDGTLQLSADTWEAFNNPAQWNYTNNPMIGQAGSSTNLGGFFGGLSRGTVPGGAGGSNSGQGGMGAGGLNGILTALARHDFQRRNNPRHKSRRSLTSYLKERNNANGWT